MEHYALLNKKGFTLIEIMVSLVVLLVVFLGLMQGALVAIDSSMRNILREEAISIAQTTMYQERNIAFANLVPVPASPATQVSRNFRNIQGFNYNPAIAVTPLDTTHSRVVVTVSWNWKGQAYSHVETALADSTYWLR
ncbi:MAG: prepilin-type N-terminal cleavage/methylation domain-containing protein [bacterium]